MKYYSMHCNESNFNTSNLVDLLKSDMFDRGITTDFVEPMEPLGYDPETNMLYER